MEFFLNQKVVYPMQGVGEIQSISERSFQGEDILYYNIYFPSVDMRVMVPTHKIEELNIRPIASKEEVQEALETVDKVLVSEPTDWKKRYEVNHKLLKKGEVGEVVRVFKSLYQRSRKKELPIQEKKLLDSSQHILEDELSLALAISTNEARDLIQNHLG